MVKPLSIHDWHHGEVRAYLPPQAWARAHLRLSHATKYLLIEGVAALSEEFKLETKKTTADVRSGYRDEIIRSVQRILEQSFPEAMHKTFSLQVERIQTVLDGFASSSDRDRIPELAQLRSLKSGWMGEGSSAPNQVALADAEHFIARGIREGLHAPAISASFSGDICFSWRTSRGKASARFEGDGFFGYAMYRNGRFEAGEADGRLEEDRLPQDLVLYLKDIYGG
ncbi:hypothetical protein [Rhodomicrobium vannielii]|uniref:hypothetical protein n=1 Tax=Rhodomicrobium vannielii TaxID=1069 RepID=UPI001AED00E0|nr:hypothetical protein [Rhodomicrobium vannielii]